MLVSTAERVSRNTTGAINDRIRRRTLAHVACLASAPPAAIQKRLDELDMEWDIERCLETMSSSLTLVGMLFGLTVRKRWFVLSAVIQGFFLQHALQGWCPPIPVLRRMGVRTAQEIEYERYALKVLRGDFAALAREITADAGEVLTAVRK